MRRHSLFTVLVRVVGVFDSQETAKAAFSEFKAKVDAFQGIFARGANAKGVVKRLL